MRTVISPALSPTRWRITEPAGSAKRKRAIVLR
jgi:hypothetical protein